MPFVEVFETIRGNRTDVYDLLRDMESYPQFMPSLNEVKVLDRGQGWTLTEWDTTLSGRKFRWTERDEFDDEDYCIRYAQTEGDLKKFEGQWLLETDGDHTKVTFTVDFDFGVPMLSSLLNPVAKLKLRQNGESMLQAIKDKFEGKSVSPN